MSGFATSEAETASSTMYESRVNMDLPVSKFTPVSTSVGRGGAPGVGDRAASGANRMRQPFASTWLPGGAGGRVGTLIDTIGHAAPMGVDRTALRAHVRPRRRAGALIDAVGNAIGVAIDRATGRIDMRARRRPGALVDPIGNAVPVGIDGAAFRVHSSPRARVGGGILVVGHAVVVGILGPGIQMEDREPGGAQAMP